MALAVARSAAVRRAPRAAARRAAVPPAQLRWAAYARAEVAATPPRPVGWCSRTAFQWAAVATVEAVVPAARTAQAAAAAATVPSAAVLRARSKRAAVLAATDPTERLHRWLAPAPTYAGWRKVLWLVWDWVRTFVRGARLMLLFTPLLCAVPVAVALPGTAPAVFRLLARTLEAAGPTYIKLGQWASTRPDLFPESMFDALTALHDQIAPHSFAETERVMTEAFGRPYTEVFAALDYEPIGSGCIAQVYVGRLRPEFADGRTDLDVAVKVVHPGTEKNMRRDLRLMLFGARLLETLVPSVQWLGVVDVVERFAEVCAGPTK